MDIPHSYTAQDIKYVSCVKILVLLTVISLAPSILIMMTSFTRIIVVLSLMRLTKRRFGYED